MINDFEDFCTWMYGIIDDLWRQIAPLFKRSGPPPDCSDSELLTLTIVGECRGWDVETEMLSYWQEHRDLFPNIPSQSRFNRRRRNLMLAFNLIRQSVLKMLDLAQERQSVIDSLPIPVVPDSTGDWQVHGAAYGKVPSRKETIFGYKLHLLITVGGLILDFELAPANATDWEIGVEMLDKHTDLDVLGDHGYISAKQAAQLWRQNRLRLRTIPRRNQKTQMSAAGKKIHNAIRQIIETVNGQLSEQFNIEHNHAHTFWGLCARLYSKLTAHTLCIYLYRLLGKPDFLHIKALAFPN